MSCVDCLEIAKADRCDGGAKLVQANPIAFEQLLTEHKQPPTNEPRPKDQQAKPEQILPLLPPKPPTISSAPIVCQIC
jgi:hypothetical protein